MDEKMSSSSMSADETTATTEKQKNVAIEEAGISSEMAGHEHRQVYGTAKTENLRTWGLWRVLLPTIVTIFALALFVVPLLILIPLLTNSITAFGTGDQGETQLLWVWITMIVLEMALCVIIAHWIFRVFFSQAINYGH
jgi:hypothetical protein